MTINSQRFLDLVKDQELKHITFFDREREDYNNINGNFACISVDKKERFNELLEDLKAFIKSYEGNTFIAKACPYKNQRNFKLYKVSFTKENSQANSVVNFQEGDEENLPESVREKLAKLEAYESRTELRENVIEQLANVFFDKVLGYVENLNINNLNLNNVMNGETEMNGTQEDLQQQASNALETIFGVLGPELTISVAEKLKQNPTKYKLLIKNFL